MSTCGIPTESVFNPFTPVFEESERARKIQKANLNKLEGPLVKFVADKIRTALTPDKTDFPTEHDKISREFSFDKLGTIYKRAEELARNNPTLSDRLKGIKTACFDVIEKHLRFDDFSDAAALTEKYRQACDYLPPSLTPFLEDKGSKTLFETFDHLIEILGASHAYLAMGMSAHLSFKKTMQLFHKKVGLIKYLTLKEDVRNPFVVELEQKADKFKRLLNQEFSSYTKRFEHLDQKATKYKSFAALLHNHRMLTDARRLEIAQGLSPSKRIDLTIPPVKDSRRSLEALREKTLDLAYSWYLSTRMLSDTEKQEIDQRFYASKEPNEPKISIPFAGSPGQKLFIRGQGSGLSWKMGQPLTDRGNGVFDFSCGQALDKGTIFKILLEDEEWESGENRSWENAAEIPGESRSNSPQFTFPSTPYQPKTTRIAVRYTPKEGELLFVSGNRPELGAWNDKIPLQRVEDDLFILEMKDIDQDMTYKIRLNDQWESGENHTLSPGEKDMILQPKFQY